MTAIDDAMRAAMADGNKVMDFYELFMGTEFFVPTHQQDLDPGERRSTDLSRERVALMVFEHEQGPVVPIFDTEERLRSWAQGREKVQYLLLGGRQLVRELDAALLYVLNPGTEQAKLFEREELDILRAQLARTRPPG